VGVADALMKVGVITPGKTKIAAVSGGIISSAPQLGIVSTKDFRTKGYEFAAKCRKNNNCMWTLDAEVKSLVRSMLPKDAYKNATDHGYITIAVPTANGSINPMTVSKYKDNEDLVGAIAAGTYIPFCELVLLFFFVFFCFFVCVCLRPPNHHAKPPPPHAQNTPQPNN
jgi:hypothetical protein